MLEDVQLHQLFGGAVEMAFPQRLIDVSDFRPVPDHQEVYADGGEDQSLIVEVLVSSQGGNSWMKRAGQLSAALCCMPCACQRDQSVAVFGRPLNALTTVHMPPEGQSWMSAHRTDELLIAVPAQSVGVNKYFADSCIGPGIHGSWVFW